VYSECWQQSTPILVAFDGDPPIGLRTSVVLAGGERLLYLGKLEVHVTPEPSMAWRGVAWARRDRFTARVSQSSAKAPSLAEGSGGARPVEGQWADPAPAEDVRRVVTKRDRADSIRRSGDRSSLWTSGFFDANAMAAMLSDRYPRSAETTRTSFFPVWRAASVACALVAGVCMLVAAASAVAFMSISQRCAN
jgi:hypothetical protein